MFFNKKKKKAKKKAKKLRFGIFGWRFAVFSVLALVLVWGLGLFLLTDTDEMSVLWVQDKFLSASVDAGFKVENILVEGRHYSDKDALLALVNVQKGDSIFLLDPREAKKQIEKISWIKSAHVERRLPNTVYIKLNERQPMALWQNDNALQLIDSEGIVLTQKSLKDFAYLPMVKGKEAPGESKYLFSLLEAEPELLSLLDHAELVEKRRWNLYLKDGKRIKLPEDDMGLAMRHVMLRQQQDKILSKDMITVIDARYKGRLIVRTKLGKVQDYKADVVNIGTPL